MAKKNKSGGSAASNKKKGAAAKTDKTKKDKNVFKVAGSKVKKPRQVEVQLRKIKENIKDKREKIDAKLKDSHEDMVVTKASKTKVAAKKGDGGGGSASSNKKATKSPPNTRKLQKKLGKMQV